MRDKTPKEKSSSVKVEISHFYIFICLVYIHVPTERRKKVDNSIRKGL